MGRVNEAELEARVAQHLAGLAEKLRSRGFGARVGFGRRPALLVVDFVRAFTDEHSPLGADFAGPVAAARELVAAAHAAGAPVLCTVPVEESGGWARKIPANDMLVPGSAWVALDERLAATGSELLVSKRYASGFFATDLATLLVSRGVDTVLIAGCTTSGCVRASAVDACSLGLHTIVVADAVGDRAPLSHRISLFDIDTKYGDVVALNEATDYLASCA
jgi:nicotinamidase-related amidase